MPVFTSAADGGGSDSNDGLSASTPFLTIQKAVDTVSALDIAGQTVTIQVANGTYTGAVSLKDVPGAIVANPPTLKGDTSTPGNVIISTTSANAVTNNSKNTLWFVQGFKLVTTTSGYALVGSNYSWTNFQNIEFGSCAGYQVYAGPNALVVGGSNYTISGGAVAHWWCEMGEIRVIGRVITLTGTPAFSAYFAYSAYTGRIVDPSTTFSGSATGVRYKVEENGVIYTGSGQAFPGSLPGVRATGGVYDSVYGTQRDTLSSARTYYVSNSGSDTNNDGLSAGSPFATIQKAWDVVSALDLSTYEVSISIADGNYTSGLVVTNGPIGYGQVTITGNVTNPSNVVVSTTNVNAFFINNPCKIKIEGVKITTTGVSTSGIAVYNAGAYVTIGKVEFGTTTTAHIYATAGKILCVTNYTITGASAYHILASLPANIEYANVAVTLSGTLAFTVFCKLDGCASGSFYGGSFTGGTITGKRWEANFNGVINVWGAGANYFPGNAAGSSLDGSGVYG